METKRKKISTVDEFLARVPDEPRAVLEKLRRTIRQAAPRAEEVISYAIPAFQQNGIVVWYAPSKNHYALYARPGILEKFKKELASYGGTKSAIHFPYDKPIPVKLVKAIVRASVKENRANAKSNAGEKGSGRASKTHA